MQERSRSPALPQAMPARPSRHDGDPGDEHRRREGFVAPVEVRCPHCDKKLGESLSGTLVATCPRCKRRVTIAR